MDSGNLKTAGRSPSMPGSEHADTPSPKQTTMTNMPHQVSQSSGGITDTGRTANALKVRKRTKTGCLSE